MKYFLHVDIDRKNNAGTKAVEDCEKILSKMSFEKIKVYSCFAKIKLLRQIIKGIQLLRLYFLPQNSIIVIQHPLPIDHNYMLDLQKVKNTRKFKYIFILHDLESVRELFDNKKIDEVMFSLSDIVIVHNMKMMNTINKLFQYPKNKMISLEIFDYLLQENINTNLNRKEKDLGVMIVGNLNPNKAGYLYCESFEKIIQGFSLYGPQFAKNRVKNANYYGQFPPELLVEKLEGSFGLVWDGNSPDTCKGKMGEYLMINNPHKTSMYLAAGFPVIIWRKAALADFVEKYQVGILVDSLWEIPERVREMTEDEYNRMLQNVSKIAKKLKQGYFLTTALNSALEKLDR